MPDPTLSEDRRKQLDGIVSQMETNQESPENIQFVVDDFKKKYATADTTTQQTQDQAGPSLWQQAKNAMYDTSPARVFNKENLPVIGGTLAALATDGASIPATAALTGIGGAIGEGARQALSGEPASPTKMLTQGAVQGGAELVGGALVGPAARALKSSAEDLMVKAFGSAGKNAGPVGAESLATVRKAAPELLKSGFSATSHGDALNQIDTILEDTGSKLDSVMKGLPEGTTLPTQPIIDYLQRAKQAITGSKVVTSTSKILDSSGNAITKSKVVPTSTATGTDEIINGVLDRQIAKLKRIGPSMTPQDAVQFRQSLGPLARFSKLQSPPENASAEGFQIAYNGLRESLNQLTPDIGPINKELSFWIGLRNVLQKQADRPQTGGTAGSILGGGLGATAVHAAGLGMGGAAGGVGAAMVMGRYVQRAMQTPGWRFASAQLKDALADAILKRDVGTVARLTFQIAGSKTASAIQGQ